MLFPDVTCVVPESLQKNGDYGLYQVLDADYMIVFTLFRKSGEYQINGVYKKRPLDQEKICAFVKEHFEEIISGTVYSNFESHGYFYHMTSLKRASPFVAFTLVVREGTPFCEKDIQWLDVYEQLNYQRVLIENEAAQVQNLQNSIFNSISTALLALDRKGRVLRLNRVAKDLFHVEQGQCFTLLDIEQNAIFQGMFSKAVEENSVQQNSEFVYGTAGSSRILSVTVSPLTDSKDKISGAAVTATDRTEKRLLQVEVEQLKRYGFLGELSMGLAHDIKNPLMVIQGCVKQLPQEYSAIKNIIQYQTGRINDAISQFMSAENYCSDSPSTALDMNQALENAVALTGKHQMGKQITFRWETDPKLPPFEAKKLHMQQIFTNLILNAMDAISSKGEIVLRSARKGDWLSLEVADNGTGISEEIFPQIFTPYFTTKKTGSGMGLFITKQLVEQYRGTINFRSQPGKGTVCTVCFPIAGIAGTEKESMG